MSACPSFLSATINTAILDSNLPLFYRHREHLKAFANYCEHYKINEHSRNFSGVLLVTFDHSHDCFGLRQSLYKRTITSYARYRERLNAFASSCEHHKINEHSCNPSGVLSVTFDHYH